MKDQNSLYKKFKNANPHVIKYRNKRILFFIFKCAAVWAVVITVLNISGSRTYLNPFSILAGGCLTVWMILKSKLFSGKWSGTIKNITVETKRVGTKGKVVAPGFYTSMHDQNYIDVFVQKDNGIHTQFDMPEEYGKVYRTGDLILSIPGIKYKIDMSNKEMTVCPRCGAIYPRVNDRCVTVGCNMQSVKYVD